MRDFVTFENVWRNNGNSFWNIDYYYSPDEIEEGDLAEKMLTAAVVEEMQKDSSIF